MRRQLLEQQLALRHQQQKLQQRQVIKIEDQVMKILLKFRENHKKWIKKMWNFVSKFNLYQILQKLVFFFQYFNFRSRTSRRIFGYAS